MASSAAAPPDAHGDGDGEADAEPSPSAAYSAAQMRIALAAVDLFAEHGVSGTSLQMIADAIGVTKAAVYHQFQTKEAIVVAAVEVELGRLQAALDAAEAPGHGGDALTALLATVIDLAVQRRRMVSTLQHDPVIVRLLADHEVLQRYMDRLLAALLRGASDPASRVRVAMVASAIGAAVTHPLVGDLDDDTLRRELLHFSRRFLDVTD
jgi:AcrR family transcriptional regulator